MKRITISYILKYGTLISTYALIGSVLLQIIARFFFENTPAWTEEASRLFFIYAMAFASGLAMKDNSYVSLDYFFEKLPPKIRTVLEVVIPIMVLLLFGLMVIYACRFVYLGIQEYSPSMKISMSFAFASMVLMALSISYYASKQIRKSIRSSDGA